MSIYPLSFTSASPYYYPTHSHFIDLDTWVHEVYGTAEYTSRVALANKIVEHHNNPQSFDLLIEGENLTSLPKALGSLTHLQELQINNNGLIPWLPTEIGQLLNLRELSLNGLAIKTLPPEIGNLRNLEVLDLEGNRFLSYLPEEIEQLENLQALNLAYTNLSYLPLGLFLLENLRLLSLLGCSFSANERDQLQFHNEDIEFPHRLIVYGPESEPVLIDRPLPELLAELYHFANRDLSLEHLYTHPDIDKLRLFLNKFTQSVEFQGGGALKKIALATKVMECLVLAEENPNYRNRFFELLKEAAAGHKESISPIILLMGLEKKLAQVDRNNLQAVYELLLGVSVIYLILEIARDKLQDLAVYEPAEISLGYLIDLREWHKFPLEKEEMLLFNSSNISSLDLHSASQEIQKYLNDLRAQSQILATQDLWKESLRLKDPVTYAQVENDVSALIQWTHDIITPLASSMSQENVNSIEFLALTDWRLI